MRSVETILQILTFDFSWAQDMQYTLSHDAGQWHWATTHSQSNHHKGKQPIHLTTILYSCSHPVFPLLVLCLTNYMRYSMFYYKIGFVLDDFAQPQANVSVLSIFKIG